MTEAITSARSSRASADSRSASPIQSASLRPSRSPQPRGCGRVPSNAMRLGSQPWRLHALASSRAPLCSFQERQEESTIAPRETASMSEAHTEDRVPRRAQRRQVAFTQPQRNPSMARLSTRRELLDHGHRPGRTWPVATPRRCSLPHTALMYAASAIASAVAPGSVAAVVASRRPSVNCPRSAVATAAMDRDEATTPAPSSTCDKLHHRLGLPTGAPRRSCRGRVRRSPCCAT